MTRPGPQLVERKLTASDLVNEIQSGTRSVMELIGRFRYGRNKFFVGRGLGSRSGVSVFFENKNCSCETVFCRYSRMIITLNQLVFKKKRFQVMEPLMLCCLSK